MPRKVGTIAAENDVVLLGDVSSKLASQAMVVLSGTWTGELTFEATTAKDAPDASFTPILARPLASDTPTTTATANGQWRVDTSGCTGFRVKATDTIADGPVLVDLSGVEG